MQLSARDEKLNLIPLHIDHADRMTQLLQERGIVDQLASVNLPYSVESSQKWIQKCQKFDTENARISQWAIVYDDQFVGEIGFHSFNPNRQTQASLGFWIGTPFQNRGIATECVRRVTNIGLTHYGFKLIRAAVFCGNHPSRRTLEKCGYQPKGLQKNYVQKEGLWIDCWLFEKGL